MSYEIIVLISRVFCLITKMQIDNKRVYGIYKPTAGEDTTTDISKSKEDRKYNKFHRNCQIKAKINEYVRKFNGLLLSSTVVSTSYAHEPS